MGVTPAPLGWVPAARAEQDRLGDEGGPLLDELLSQRAPSLRSDLHPAQRKALRALIRSAFGRDIPDLFDPVLAHLPHLIPADAIVPPKARQADDDRFLSRHARPSDPDHAAIVAVIDHAIPFAHPLFTTASGHNRVAALWLMDAIASEARPDIAFGRELRGPRIDALRRPGDPDHAYRDCGLMTPGRSMVMAAAASHGAAVAALAGGHDPQDDAGRQHPLLAVSLPRIALAETSGSLAAPFICSAVAFVMARARALARELSAKAGKPVRPALIVNLSLGVTAGAGDETAALARLLDIIAGRRPVDLGPVHVVVPTGNNRQDRLRARLHAGQGVGWQIPPADSTANAIEIWGAVGEAMPRIGITTPEGAQIVVPLEATGAGRITDAKGATLARVVAQRRGGPAGRACLTVIVPPTLPNATTAPCAPPGLWRLTLHQAGTSGCDLAVHRDDRLPGFRGQGRQSRLVDPGYRQRTDDGRWPGADDPAAVGAIRRNGTLSAYARGQCPIRVGASLARPPRPDQRVSPYSGLLPDGAPGDLTAPADASATLGGMLLPGIAPAGRQRLSGTSLSAPQLSRWLAATLAGGCTIPDRKALVQALNAAAETTPDLGPPSLPWRHGLGD